MSGQILLLNPRRRRRHLRNPRRGRYARRRHHSNPRRHVARRRHRMNPRHRVRSHWAMSDRGRRYRVRSHMSNPRRRRHLRNPREYSARGILGEFVMPAAVGAVGAVGLKIGWGYLSPYLPAAIQSGWGALAGQTGVVLLAGWGLSKALPRHRRGVAAGVVGALTVIVYNAAVQLLQQYVPNLAGLRDYTDYGMGAYMSAAPAAMLPSPTAHGALPPPSSMGWTSPAPGVGAYMQYGPAH